MAEIGKERAFAPGEQSSYATEAHLSPGLT